MSAQLPLVVVNRTHLCAQLMVYPVHHVSFLSSVGCIIQWYEKSLSAGVVEAHRYCLFHNTEFRTVGNIVSGTQSEKPAKNI